MREKRPQKDLGKCGTEYLEYGIKKCNREMKYMGGKGKEVRGMKGFQKDLRKYETDVVWEARDKEVKQQKKIQ